jgi:UDP-glucose 4-epimerase
MASRGSVIPLFVDQIKSGKDLTITDPNMTRFMMTLEDAVDLVIYAFQHGKNGDMFIQKSPASTIGDLAQALIDLYQSKSKVRVIGTRHGEKLYETLVNREEMAKSIDMGNYYRVPADNRDLNYDSYFTKGEEKVSEFDDYHSHNTLRLDIEGTKQLLLKLPLIRRDILNEVVTQYID